MLKFKREKKFIIKIQDQEFPVEYGKWYGVKFYIKGVKGKKYYSEDIKIKLM